jgi:tight adherence protein B
VGEEGLTMSNVFSALFIAGAMYFAAMWFIARWELASRSEIERRRDAIAAANRERVSLRNKARAAAGRYGWNGDLTLLGFGLLFFYVVVIVGLTMVGISGWIAPIIAVPASVLVIMWAGSSTTQRRRAAFDRQLVQALDLLVAQLQAGTSPSLALERIVPNLPDPLRSEFDAALAQNRASMDLSEAISNVADRYPSRAMTMLVAAIRIDEKRGAKMAAALEQAANSVRRDFELRAESDAEVAQERMQFFGIVGIVGGIALFLLARGSQEQREAMFSPTGVFLLSIAASNFVFGIIRVTRMLAKAKGE